MWRRQAQGADYFAEVGRPLRIASAIALTPFALFLGLAAITTPIAGLSLALGKDPKLGGYLVLGGMVCVPPAWFLAKTTVRLYRGTKSSNGVTVLPTWVVRLFLCGFLGPLSVVMAVGMLKRAYDTAVAGDRTTAGILAAGACGFLVGLVRAAAAAIRLGRMSEVEVAEGRPRSDSDLP